MMKRVTKVMNSKECRSFLDKASVLKKEGKTREEIVKILKDDYLKAWKSLEIS